jgi:hypothetical protein
LIVCIMARTIQRGTRSLYTGTRGHETDAIEHMANCTTGPKLLMLSSPSSMRNSLLSRTLGRHVRCPLATRSVLPVTSSVRLSPKRSRNGESSSEAKRPVKPRRRRQRRRQPRRPRKSARRRRKPLVATRLSRLRKRGKMGLHQRPLKRRYQGVWSKSVSRHRSVII